MAKRTIQECDLTKQEIPDGDEVVSITIKRNGKKTGRTYEISSEAAAILEQQLVAGKESMLNAKWTFAGTSQVLKRTLEDFDNDEIIIAEKRAELKEAGVIERQESTPDTISDDQCRHMNKGRIQATIQNGKRFIYRLCSDCRTRIPEPTLEDKKSYMNTNLMEDIRIRDFDRKD